MITFKKPALLSETQQADWRNSKASRILDFGHKAGDHLHADKQWFLDRTNKIYKIFGGEAAQIAGLSRLPFETVLAENSLPISTLSVADVLADIQKLG